MAKKRPSVRRWSWDKTLSEPALIASLSNKGYQTTRWSNKPGHKYPVHTHDFDKVILVIRGSITFTIPRIVEEYVLHAGDRLELPAGYAHGAEVGSQGVTCIEGHTPEENET
jgi:quercetin dioxygenase-like cupin family protein